MQIQNRKLFTTSIFFFKILSHTSQASGLETVFVVEIINSD